jgi:hypothetical protein
MEIAMLVICWQQMNIMNLNYEPNPTKALKREQTFEPRARLGKKPTDQPYNNLI